jgi:hypothetical protein
MITGLRSALICANVVTHNDGRTDLIGIVGGEISADSRPGVVQAWLSLQIELDRKATTGRVLVECDGLKQDFPFSAPAGHAEAGAAFPLIIPVLKEGTLWVTVFDDQAKVKPLRQKWRLKFTANAEELEDPAGAARQIADTCQKAAASVADRAKPDVPTRH